MTSKDSVETKGTANLRLVLITCLGRLAIRILQSTFQGKMFVWYAQTTAQLYW